MLAVCAPSASCLSAPARKLRHFRSSLACALSGWNWVTSRRMVYGLQHVVDMSGCDKGRKILLIKVQYSCCYFWGPSGVRQLPGCGAGTQRMGTQGQGLLAVPCTGTCPSDANPGQ